MENTALIIIDVQNDYFPNGKMALPGAVETGTIINTLLEGFRKKKFHVFHIQHEALQEGAGFFLPKTKGQEIHESVKPMANETVIKKHYPNSFHKTGLLEDLKKKGVTTLVITGMMTFMCVDATARAAKDLGFECILIDDATAAPALEYKGISCSAEQVKAAFTYALAYISDRVTSSEEFLKEL
ncbi:MAG: cysteine hydrolase [Deltaproteobacteria bacterium]|nr:cysteine hydrolase [Deltaproteobacteria bacterium]